VQKQFPIGVSIMGHPAKSGPEKLEGVLECVRRSIPLADFIEINESCPNVKHASTSDELAARLKEITKVRDDLAKQTGRRVPILVKVADVGDASTTVRLMSKSGIDGLISVNTQRDYDSFELPVGDRKLLEFYTEKYGGGLSGQPIKQRALDQVSAVVAAVRAQKLGSKFTVIHVGGIGSAQDVQSSRGTGAQLRQWYTGYMNCLAEGVYNPLDLYPAVTA